MDNFADTNRFDDMWFAVISVNPIPGFFYLILLLISRIKPTAEVAFAVYENIILFLLPNKLHWEDKWFNKTIMQ